MIQYCCFLRRRAESYIGTIVSKESAAPIFKVKVFNCSEDMVRILQTMISIYQITHYRISEDSSLYSHSCESLKFYNVITKYKSLGLERDDESRNIGFSCARKSVSRMETKSSLQLSQELATVPFPEKVQYCLHPQTLRQLILSSKQGPGLLIVSNLPGYQFKFSILISRPSQFPSCVHSDNIWSNFVSSIYAVP